MKLTRRTLLVSGAGAMAAMAMPHVARAQNLHVEINPARLHDAVD